MSSGFFWGSEIDTMTDQELAQVVEITTVFAKLSPDQKHGSFLALRTMAQGGVHGRWD